jgi:uncharacterized protein (DUF924 family)
MRREIEHGHDSALLPIERAFLFMPLEHSEDLALQDESVRRFREVAATAPGHQAELFQSFVEHAEGHRTVISRFGRFPHRNSILGRESTQAEREFLASGGADWGQSGDG